MKLVLYFALCLPGLAASMTLNPAVSQGTIGQTICVPGWTKTVRPTVAYTNRVKRQLLHGQGNMADYELDHVVPLTLGGAPRDARNLQLQPWASAKAKDVVETYLNRRVCAGKVPLATAQRCIFNHWQQCGKL